jgi:broad specificity phosphatase PhoE
MKPIAILVRHPEVDPKYKGMFVSWTDVAISEAGEHQAKETLAFIEANFDIKRVYSSPLKRALFFAETLGLPVAQERALLPWNRGVLTGLAESEAKDTLKLYMQNPDIRIPMGESRNECEERLEGFYGPAFKEAEREFSAFFTHHSNIDVLNGLVLGKHHGEPVNLVKTAGVVAVYVDGDGYRLEPVYRADDKAAASMS